MSFKQTTTSNIQPLGDDFRSHLVKYQPKKANEVNFNVLSNLTEYRDYKFSNGFWYLDKNELQNLASRMSASNFETLLDQLYGASTELYNLFKKVLMNESTDEEYHEYNKLLESTGVMKYNYSRLYGN
jgi:DNA primase large subunit